MAIFSGICCDVDPDEVSAVEPDDDEGIEQVETDSWNNEQVHGGDVRRVVTQEGPPSLAGRPPPFDHVLGYAQGQDGQNETEQPDHSDSLGDSITSSTRIRFSVHTTGGANTSIPIIATTTLRQVRQERKRLARILVSVGFEAA
jgi:hypothetical protein